jgi:hypothetical protein
MRFKKQEYGHKNKRGDLFDTAGKVFVQISPAQVL